VVTLVGAAGVGKSRFVDELVADLAVDQPMLRAYRGAAREDRGAHAAIATILRVALRPARGSDAHARPTRSARR
jgi:predicted kinase